jgi:hypothetical protein
MARRNTPEDFWKLVDKRGPDDCWLWLGKRHRSASADYGIMNGLMFGERRAHRISYILTTGDDPGRDYVCHHCDNPLCVNPAHLFRGTPSQNTEDANRKGRAGRQKLNEQSAREVKRLLAEGVSTREIAERFGITQQTARNIRNGYIWAWLK